MIIKNITLRLPDKGYVGYNGKRLYTTVTEHDANDILYLTYLDNLVGENLEDTPIITTDQYKWNLKKTVSPVFYTMYITSDIATQYNIPFSYVGCQYTELWKYASTDFICPGIDITKDSFNWSFWGFSPDLGNGAGGLFGIRYHFLYKSKTLNDVTYRTNDAPYTVYLSYPQNAVTYNESRLLSDDTCYYMCDEPQKCHHFAFEWDAQNKMLYCFTDGVLKVKYGNGTNIVNRFGTGNDSTDYSTRYACLELCFRKGLLHTGSGADARYPVPTEPIKNSI